jgi:hypothetical protein
LVASRSSSNALLSKFTALLELLTPLSPLPSLFAPSEITALLPLATGGLTG